MYPILGEVFGRQIPAFGVMVALGFLMGYWFASAQARKTGITKPEVIGDLLMWLLLGGIAGARILYVTIHWNKYSSDPISAFKIWEGGIVYYGGFLGAFLAAVIFCRKHKLSLSAIGDLCMPGAMLGQGIGRIGCLLVGDDFGKVAPEGLPWAITFPRNMPGSLMPPDMTGIPLHPAQLYMMTQSLIIFFILWMVLKRRKFEGQVMYLGLMLYPIGRSICELYRADDEARGIYFGLSTSQWISIPLFLLGLVGYLRLRQRPLPATSSSL